MAVNIDPSEVRHGASSLHALRPRGFRLPLRAVLIGGIGGAGLIAFSVGAFSFFSTLADPRAPLPRIAPAAASMPDLKDGMPALVTGEPAGAAPKATTFNLPRPDPVEPAPAATTLVEKTAAQPGAAGPGPAKVAAEIPPSRPEALSLRSGANPPPIENAATLPETRTTVLVAPARQAATIAPAKTEIVKAKPVQPGSVATVAAPEHRPEPTSTATATSAAIAPARKAVAAKPPVQKAAARKASPAGIVADAEPAAAPVAASAASEDSEIPGARQFRAGMKAIGGIFGGDKDE